MTEEEKNETKVVETKENIQKQTTSPKTNLAIIGLILGIIGIVLSFIPLVNGISYILGILAIIFGIIGFIKIDKKTLAIIAIILGILSIIFPILINMYIFKKATNFIGNALTETIKNTEEIVKQNETITPNETPTTPDKTPTNSNKIKIEGETFIFNNFEITISKDYSFDVVNREGPYHGAEAIVLPVTFKNLKEDETNWFSYSEYRVTGSKGLRVESLCDF